MTLTDEQARDLMRVLDAVEEFRENVDGYCVFCGAWNEENRPDTHIHMVLTDLPHRCAVTIARELKAAIEGKE